ncbi:conserved protein of unknown function [Burkholderia multivorans]
MISMKTPFSTRASRFSLRLSAGLVAGASLCAPLAGHASGLGDGIRQLGASRAVTRSVSLADLGVNAPVSLVGDARQEFYLPVPKGQTLADASIAFDGRYLKGQPGLASMVLTVDGEPLVSQSLPDGGGPLQRAIAVSPRPRDTGFVRLGVNWLSRNGVRRCEEDHSMANAVTITPQTRLTYRVDPRGVASLDDAWSMLPGTPTLLVAGRKLNADAFDSAWRIGVALERSGKRVAVRALPAVGETVDTRGLDVPAALSAVPAFAALRDNAAAHRLANDAELGAVLALGAPAVSGDLVVADAAMHARLAAAFDALQAQLAGDADARDAFGAWRAQRAPLAGGALAPKQIVLSSVGGQPVIAIAGDAGAQAASLFDDRLRHLLATGAATAPVARLPETGDKQVVRLSSLGGSADSFDVLARGDWSVNFPLSAVSSDGRMPSEVTVYVSAAPGPSSSRPVATLYWNGVLLAARQLTADGTPERLRARVPGYALGVNNALRVSVQRQPYSADCNEIPQAYPVDVLPSSSYITPGDAEPDGTFVGLLPLLGGEPQLIVPKRYLDAAPQSLGRVIGVAAASGLSASRAELTVVDGGKPAEPTRPFLAMEVDVDGAKPSAVVTGGQHLRIGGKDTPWLDVSGLQRLSTAEVVRGNGQHGVLWYALGAPAETPDAPFLLNRGNLAVIGAAGPVAWIDSSNPDASLPPGAGESAFYEWRRYISLGVPAAGIALLVFVSLLILALRARRNKRSGD